MFSNFKGRASDDSDQSPIGAPIPPLNPSLKTLHRFKFARPIRRIVELVQVRDSKLRKSKTSLDPHVSSIFGKSQSDQFRACVPPNF
jgi:hypothetical protein